MFKKDALRLVCLLILVMAVSVILFLAYQNRQTTFYAIDQYLNQNNFQGTLLIAKEGKILLNKGYGFANQEHLIPNKAETVFRAGSITKQFTAVIILQLQEKGLLNVHDPLTKFLPDYPEGNRITLHHLLSHTSGVEEITDFLNLSEIQRHPSTPEKVMAYFKDLPLRFPPGSKYEYSNSGYIVLGAVIESIIQQPYEQYLKENIFDRAGMKNAYLDRNQKIISNRASGYASDKEGALVNAEFVEMSFPHAAGSLSMTAGDLFLFHEALYEGKLLSDSSFKLLFTPHALTEKKGIFYGYGFFLDENNHSKGHMGEIEGFRAAFYHYVDHHLTIIVLSNHENIDAFALQSELFSKLLSVPLSGSWRI